MDKRPNIIARMFDRIAPSYDRLNTILSLSLDKGWRRAVIRALDLHEGERVLDIATGTGDMALLALAYTPCRVTGIDLSRQMLIRAVAKAERRNHGAHYTALQGNALSMPFPDGTFSKAMVGFGIRNMDNIPGLFAEVHRVLKPSGRLAVLEFSVPEQVPFKWFYMFYLRQVMPTVGGIVSGDFPAYRYLRDSVLGFPAPPVLEDMLKRHGLRIVASQALFWGIAHLYLAEKS
ncbi:MAG: ubiquinone/menaquinone biosynthesis methyltransferase [Syntrophaceae bacterium]